MSPLLNSFTMWMLHCLGEREYRQMTWYRFVKDVQKRVPRPSRTVHPLYAILSRSPQAVVFVYCGQSKNVDQVLRLSKSGKSPTARLPWHIPWCNHGQRGLHLRYDRILNCTFPPRKPLFLSQTNQLRNAMFGPY
jgi:hypothetical protein